MVNLDEYDWAQALVVAGVSRDEILHILGHRIGQGDGDSWMLLFVTPAGKFGVLTAWCDYTGWDCQSGGSVKYANTLKEAQTMLLTSDERRALGCPLPEDVDGAE